MPYLHWSSYCTFYCKVIEFLLYTTNEFWVGETFTPESALKNNQKEEKSETANHQHSFFCI